MPPTRAKLVLAPHAGFATVAEGLAALDWQREPDRSVMPPSIPGEPELVSWSRPGEDTRATYTFNPVVRLRVIALSGERAAERAREAAARLPVLGDDELERLLASADLREILLGILAAENLDALACFSRLAALCGHPEPAVARAAERARKKIAERVVGAGLARLAQLEARDPQRSALFARVGDAALRRQILRWLIHDRRSLDAGTLAVLRSGLEDPDAEVRTTAMLAAARLGARELLPAVRSTSLPQSSREGVSPLVRDLLRALRQAAAEHLAGVASPARHGREEMADRVRRLVAGTYGEPDEWVSLLVHAHTEPIEMEGPGPEPLPTGVIAAQDGWALAQTGIELCWIAPIPHWLGGAEDDPVPLRRQAPLAGVFIARRPLTRAQARRLGAEVIGDEADSAPYRCAWADAARLCEALGRLEGVAAALPSADLWEMAARGPDGRVRPWGNALPADAADLSSPWGVEQVVETGGEWTSTRGAGLTLVCGADRLRRCAVRMSTDQESAAFAVRPIILHPTPEASPMTDPKLLLARTGAGARLGLRGRGDRAVTPGA